MELNLFNQEIAEVKLTYSHKVKPSNQIKVTSSREIYNQVAPLWEDMDYRESFAILLLSRSMKILGISWISLGGISGCVVDVRLIFQAALKANSSYLVILHNHPSGNLSPSSADIAITQKIKSGAKLLNIDIPDHIILTSDSYYSFADEGMI